MKKLYIITIFITLAVCLMYTARNRWKGYDGEAWKSTINSDGYGYYAYLPCIFIYHKFDYKKAWDEERKIRPDANGFSIPLPGNKFIDKYFPGVALLLAPFFLIAYLLSYLLGYTTGGYEFLFQASVSIGALFYLAIGLVFLYKLLKQYSISEPMACLTLILIVFATNLFYYSIMEPSMSHVYSFGLSAFFLYHAKKSIDEFKIKNLILVSISIGMLTLIRPTNLMDIAFIPFLAGSWNSTLSFIARLFKTKKILFLLLIPASIFFIQFFLCYLQAGRFFIWNYPGESFYFLKPYFLDILFSYRKGLFIYTPIIFIAIIGGLFAISRQSVFRFFSALFFSLTVTYVLSCWWSWWYGGSFGSRAFIDFYPVFALFLALFLHSLISQWLKLPVILILFLCIGLNLFQINQYRNAIILYDGMTKQKYWKVFLKSAPSYKFLFNYPDTLDYNFFSIPVFKNDFEQNTWGNNQTITNVYAHSGTHSVFINQQNNSSPVFSENASEIPKATSVWIYAKTWIRVPDFDNNAQIVVTLQTEKGESYFWQGQTLQGFVFKPNVWSLGYAVVALPTIKNPSDKLSVYVLTTTGSAYIDDMEIRFGVAK